jgi:5-formaminoimidazole-4-carboxamide-1-beta-D-ribofuranosyl 5'-monophosphate synthetase
MTNAHSKTGQMAVCFQNLTLGALSSHSALSVLVGALFKKYGLFLNNPRTA